MKASLARTILPLAVWTLGFSGSEVIAEDAATLWARKVQPLLDIQCTKCHGPIEQKGGLELDTPEAALKGGDAGPAVVPGKPEASPLFTNLAADADPHMPPKKQLSDAEREVIRQWIVAMGSAPTVAKPAMTEARNFTSITEAIDTLIAEGWKQRSIQPAAPLADGPWLRRVTLDLAGRIPTPQETETFLQHPPETRRASAVDRLLSSEEYPIRMRELWDVLLLGRTKRENHEDRRKNNQWWAFLETAFRTNRPWNHTVRDFLVGRNDKPESKGSSWFLYERRNEHQRIAEAVAPVVYGTQIDCAQCHDHPLAREIKQGHYWGLVAAFNRSKNVERSNEVAESAVGGFINFTNLKKESQPALVMLLNGKTVDEARPAGDQKENDSDDKYIDPKAKARVPKFSRREAFAEAATQGNPLLARAFVNRMWSVLIGRGIVHPADEMNARNVPSHPALLDWLARDFAAHDHDARRFIRGVVLSQVYGLDRKAEVAPESFASALERPLSAEQLARSWRIAAGLPPADDALRRAVISAIPEVLPKEYNATYQQAQFLTNSPLLAKLLQPEEGNTVERLAALPEPAARVKEAFLAVYGRIPDAEESSEATKFLEARAAQPKEAVRDLMWALFTSAEFLSMP